MDNWKKVESIHLLPNEKAVLEDSQITIYRKDETLKRDERDVTKECRAELCQSQTSSGYYCGIYHGNRKLFALGVDEKSKVIPFNSKGYKLELAPGATVSFRVIKI